MSDYFWTCPGCGSRIHWGDSSHYSEEIDDKICSECYTNDEEEKKRNEKETNGRR